MKEEWKDVPGFEGIVSASTLGRVKVVQDGLVGIYEACDNEYHQLRPTINGVRYYKRLHQWVAEAFIPNPENKPTVNHIDGNKGNNKPNNLEWATYKENNNHALMLGLNDLNIPGGKAETRRLATISMPVIFYSDKVYVFLSLRRASEYLGTTIENIKSMYNIKVFPRGTKLKEISELEGISYEIIH